MHFSGTCIANMSEFKFSVHIAVFSASSWIFDLNGKAKIANPKHKSASIAPI
jgi:hypothetical protein